MVEELANIFRSMAVAINYDHFFVFLGSKIEHKTAMSINYHLLFLHLLGSDSDTHFTCGKEIGCNDVDHE